jgi:hypothetical protein
VLTGTLEQSLSRTLPGGKVGAVVSIDRSQFAAAYEGSVLSMDALTPHQLEKMQECLTCDYVHLQAPAGAGKTFVALNRVLELLYEEKEARALFVARNAALCYFVIRWVCRRVRNTLQRLLMLKRLDVLFEPFSVGPQAVKLERGRIQMVSRAALDVQYSLVVVDEAHHIYKDRGMRDAVEIHVPAGCRRMLLSDISQSSGRDIDWPEPDGKMLVVKLTEVVRSSQRIVAGAAAFQLGENKAEVTSQHNATGPPLKSFLFDADGAPGSAEYFGSYVEHMLRALHHVMTTFGTLELHDRVAIVVPDGKFAAGFRASLETALFERWPERPFQLVSAQEAAASALPGGAGRGPAGEWLVLDDIAAFDGLERLIVLAIGLDAVIDQSSSSSTLETRSRLYRALTRAHMLAIVVNEFLPGGWLEFLGQVSLKDGSAAFNRKEEMEMRMKRNAVDKQTGDAMQQATKDEEQAEQKMQPYLLAWRTRASQNSDLSRLAKVKYRADLSRLAKEKYRRSLPPWMALGAEFESVYGRQPQTEAELVGFAKAMIEELVGFAKAEAKTAEATKVEATLETEVKVEAVEVEAEVDEREAVVEKVKPRKPPAKIAQSVWDTSDNVTTKLTGPASFNPFNTSEQGRLVSGKAAALRSGDSIRLGKTGPQELGLAGGESWTIELWVRVDSIKPGEANKSDQTVFGVNDYGVRKGLHCVFRVGGKLWLSFYNGGGDALDPTPIEVNVWTHFALQFEKDPTPASDPKHLQGDMRIFRNGVEVAASRPKPLIGNVDLFLGQYAGGRPLLGSVAQVRLWNVALSTSQIGDRMYTCAEAVTIRTAGCGLRFSCARNPTLPPARVCGQVGAVTFHHTWAAQGA